MNNHQQMEMFRVEKSDVNVAWLEKLLAGRGWMTAGEILRYAGLDESDVNKRWIRSLAEASTEIVSGQKGYAHIERVTPEEVKHFVNWMESQARKMFERAERVRRKAHAIIG